MSLDARKLVFGGLRTTPAKTSLRRLISAYVEKFFLESFICELATGKISSF